MNGVPLPLSLPDIETHLEFFGINDKIDRARFVWLMIRMDEVELDGYTAQTKP